MCVDNKGVKTPWPLNCISPRRSNEEHKLICNPGEMIIYENITVENGSGGAQTYTLLQQGSTNQSVTVSFTCNTAGGCSASLTQGS